MANLLTIEPLSNMVLLRRHLTGLALCTGDGWVSSW